MNKGLKILISIVGALAVIIVAAVVILPKVIDPNQYKGRIAQAVKQGTGRDFEITGEIGLSVFPWLGLTVDGVTLGNAPGFGPEPMAKVQRVAVSVKLVPLLSRNIEMQTVVLDGLSLSLGKNAKGVSNWDDLASADETKAAGKEPGAAGPAEWKGVAGIAVEGLEIKNANVAYNDKQAGVSYAVNDMSLATGALEPGKPVAVDLRLGVESAKPVLKAAIGLTSTFDVNSQAKTLAAKDLTLNLNILESSLGEGPAAKDLKGLISLAANADVDWGKGLVVLQGAGIKTDLAGGALPGALKSTLNADVSADWKKKVVQLNGLKLDAKMTGDKLPGGSMDALASSDVSLDWGKESVTISDLVLKAMDLDVRGNLNAASYSTSPKLAGSLHVAEFSPRKLIESLGGKLETRDTAALAKASADVDLAYSADSLKINNLRAVVDESQITGSSTVRGFDAPNIGFAVDVTKLDLDRYLPSPSEKKPQAASQNGEKGVAKTENGMLRKLVVDGTAKVGWLKVYNVQASDVVMTVKGRNGVFTFDPLSADLYRGKLNGVLTATLGEDGLPATQLKVGLVDMALGGLLADLTGKKPAFEGLTTMNLDLDSAGGVLKNTLRTLNGLGDFAMRDAVIRDFRLGPQAFLQGVAGQAAPADTTFDRISGSFKITNGVLNTVKNLVMNTAKGSISAGGSADLADQNLDMKLNLQDAGIPSVPLKVVGSFDNPRISVDQEALVKGAGKDIKGKAEEAVGKVLDKPAQPIAPPSSPSTPTPGKALEDLGKGLGNIFGGQKQ